MIWILYIIGFIYLCVFIYATYLFYSDINEMCLWKRILYSMLGSIVYTIAIFLFTPLLVITIPFGFLIELNKRMKFNEILNKIKDKYKRIKS